MFTTLIRPKERHPAPLAGFCAPHSYTRLFRKHHQSFLPDQLPLLYPKTAQSAKASSELVQREMLIRPKERHPKNQQLEYKLNQKDWDSANVYVYSKLRQKLTKES